MSFATAAFGYFLVLVFAVYWTLRRARCLRLSWLLVVSYVFYSFWNAKYLLLIAGSTALDYWVGARLWKTPDEQQRRRRQLLVVSLVGNLGSLAVFKYHDFFRENLQVLLERFGVHIPALPVLLPVGISFYTFQSMSYTLDVYWKRIEPARNLWEFALFVAFFPQLVAGPIVRASEFLPQLAERARLGEEDLRFGLFRILEGLFKKCLVADVLAVELVDRVFAEHSTIRGPLALVGVYGYALQIYGDFAGYSDIAIGAARLLGFRLPENFDVPYKAASITEFWRRWHLSLSTWLRDYLYIPLGGNRKGRLRTHVNLMITMLLGGLWHGSSWTFVFWGGLHGVWLSLHRWWRGRVALELGSPWYRALAVLVTFHLVCFAWVFFRSSSFGAAWELLGRIGQPGDPSVSLSRSGATALVLGFGTHFLPEGWKAAFGRWLQGRSLLLWGVLWAAFLGLVAQAGRVDVPFVYFQF